MSCLGQTPPTGGHTSSWWKTNGKCERILTDYINMDHLQIETEFLKYIVDQNSPCVSSSSDVTLSLVGSKILTAVPEVCGASPLSYLFDITCKTQFIDTLRFAVSVDVVF